MCSDPMAISFGVTNPLQTCTYFGGTAVEMFTSVKEEKSARTEEAARAYLGFWEDMHEAVFRHKICMIRTRINWLDLGATNALSSSAESMLAVIRWQLWLYVSGLHYVLGNVSMTSLALLSLFQIPYKV